MQALLHNNDETDKGEDSACPGAGARRMPEVFMLALDANLREVPNRILRLGRSAQVVGI